MNSPALQLILQLTLLGSLSATTYDFGNGSSSGNNSTNGGLGNVIAAEGASPSQTATIDGIQLTINAVSSGTGTLGSNSQGWGVLSSGESGTTQRRLGSASGEAFEFSFDDDVTLDSFRFGSFGNGEVVTLEFVSGTNPFTVGTSLTISGDGNQGPDFDILLASNGIVSGGIGMVTAGTVLRLTTSTPTAGGVLFNEMSIGGSAPPPSGNLTTSILPTFPVGAIAANPNPAGNLGSAPVRSSDSLGQSFSLPAGTSLDSFVFEIDSVTATGDFTLEIFRAMDGLPWLPAPLYSTGVTSYSGTLPAGLTAGGLLKIDLPAPLDVLRGSYTVALTGIAATDFSLVLTTDALYPTGALSRDNAGTNGWEPFPAPDSDAVFAVLGTEDAPAPAAPAGAPNIVFILVDDLGWTDIRTGGVGPNVIDGTDYGSGYYQTPNLARLAAEGLSFTNCYVQPNCAPTRAAILSGQYSPRSGNDVYAVNGLNRGKSTASSPPAFDGPSQRNDVPGNHVISAEALQSGGYVTAHLGKYHVGGKDDGAASLPEAQGFDANFGGDSNGAPGSYHASGQQFSNNQGPGLDAYAKDYTQSYIDTILKGPAANPLNTRALDDPALFPNGAVNLPDALVNGNKHLEDGLGDGIIAFMKDHLNGSMSERPFYVQLHNYAVHSPTGDIHARADLLTKYNSVPTTAGHDSASYAAIVESMDQTVGRILDFLDDPDGDGNPADSIASNTLVVFVSDNGGHIGATDNDPIRHRKGSFYDGGIRVPLIVRQPGTVAAGSQSDSFVHAVDFYPTLVEAAGLSMPTVNQASEPLTFDGTSFAVHMTDPVASPRDREGIFYHFPGYLDQRARPCEVMLKKIHGRDYKLIYTYDLNYTGDPTSTEDLGEGLDVLSEPWELYCLSDDIGETSDLLNGSYSNWLLYGDIATSMADDLVAWLNQGGSDWDAKKLTLDGTSTEVPLMTTTNLPVVTVPFADTLRIVDFSTDFDTNMVTIEWPGESGFLYNIEVSNNLTDWNPVASDVPGAGNPTSHTVSDPLLSTETERFYRLVLHD